MKKVISTLQTEPGEQKMDIKLLRLNERPELKEAAALWFHSKWGVPLEAYTESMEQSLLPGAVVPRWYLALEGEDIVGGMGVIENDFHDHPDLRPNVCAVYTELRARGQGIAGSLLAAVAEDMAAEGIGTLYLVTDHDSFYERYGWEFYCTVNGDDGETRMYIHRQK